MDILAFNLSINEGFFDEEPRRCSYERRVRLAFQTGEASAMLVRVSPPYSSSRYCVDSPEINFAALIARSTGDTLFPVSIWPLSVSVLIPLINRPELRESMSHEEVIAIGVGLIYLDGKDAAVWVAKSR